MIKDQRVSCLKNSTKSWFSTWILGHSLKILKLTKVNWQFLPGKTSKKWMNQWEDQQQVAYKDKDQL